MVQLLHVLPDSAILWVTLGYVMIILFLHFSLLFPLMSILPFTKYTVFFKVFLAFTFNQSNCRWIWILLSDWLTRLHDTGSCKNLEKTLYASIFHPGLLCSGHNWARPSCKYVWLLSYHKSQVSSCEGSESSCGVRCHRYHIISLSDIGQWLLSYRLLDYFQNSIANHK